MKKTEQAEETKMRILMHTMNLIRTKGYNSTRVEDICAASRITKGAFFHHFKSKEEVAEAAAAFFSQFADQLFQSAPFQSIEDPLERLLGYIDFRLAILQGEIPQFTCLLGTMVQEVHQTNPVLRQACQTFIWSHADTLVPTIREATEKYKTRIPVEPAELALYTQAVLQGAFVLAKAEQSTEAATACVRQLRRHVEMLFERPSAAPDHLP